MLAQPKPKTRRAKRALEKRESKIIENVKTAMFIKGHNTSAIVNEALKDLYSLKKPDAVFMKKKNPILPFEDASTLEFFSNKNDSSLFALGSSTNKRPHNIVFGRMFNHQLLDLIELGISQFKPIEEFKTEKCATGAKHAFVFTGELFEQREEFQLLRSMLLDFYRGYTIEQINLAGLDHVISVTATQEGKIFFRVYVIQLKKSGSKLPRVELEEMGPSIDFEIRRTKFAAKDVLKEALKIPRTVKPKKEKNVTTDSLGKKYGRIHLGKQDLGDLALRKMKGLKRSRAEKEDEKSSKRSRVEDLS